jgi:hypothetical protein
VRRSEAFVWLSVVGLLLLWSTLPVGVAFGGMFDCFGNDDQCRAAVDRQATAVTISNAVLIAFTVVAVAAVIVGRHRLPVVLLAMSISALVLGLVSLITRGGLSPWVPAGFWVTIPATVLLATGSARQVRWYGRRA